MEGTLYTHTSSVSPKDTNLFILKKVYKNTNGGAVFFVIQKISQPPCGDIYSNLLGHYCFVGSKIIVTSDEFRKNYLPQMIKSENKCKITFPVEYKYHTYF